MPDFSQDIQNFQRYGVYQYKFDSTGNIIFNSSSADFSQVYCSFPLRNIVYDSDKIKTMYNTNFEEFMPQVTVQSPQVSVDNLQQQLDAIQQENDALKSQLDFIISQNALVGSAADQMASKQVILELRKATGQGRVDSDFSDTFPYTPIRKEIV